MTFYITDGSEESFYTAVFDCYKDREGIITCRGDLQMTLDSTFRQIKADESKCARVKNKIAEYDGAALNDIKLVLRSCAGNREQTALEYIRLIMQHKRPVRAMTHIPAVLEMEDIRKKVTGELHKMKGFLRFMENDRGVLYAPYSPDNDITRPHRPALCRTIEKTEVCNTRH